MIKPLNKPDNLKTISTQSNNPNKSINTHSAQSQANLRNKNSNDRLSQNFNQDKKTIRNNTNPPPKSPAKPPIQLIAKPKNINNIKSNEPSKNRYKSVDNKQLINKPDQNTNKSKTKNLNNRINTPELVGAPIRRNNPNINPNKQDNKQNLSFKKTDPNRPGTPNRPIASNRPGAANRPGMPNRQGSSNRPGIPNRPGMPNRQGSSNRPGIPNRPGMPNRQGSSNRPGMPNRQSSSKRPDTLNKQVNPNRIGSPNNSENFRQGTSFRQSEYNKPGSKFSGQKYSGVRKPESPKEILQLQKTNKSENNKL